MLRISKCFGNVSSQGVDKRDRIIANAVKKWAFQSDSPLCEDFPCTCCFVSRIDSLLQHRSSGNIVYGFVKSSTCLRLDINKNPKLSIHKTEFIINCRSFSQQIWAQRSWFVNHFKLNGNFTNCTSNPISHISTLEKLIPINYEWCRLVIIVRWKRHHQQNWFIECQLAFQKQRSLGSCEIKHLQKSSNF